MVKLIENSDFKKEISKIKDLVLKERIKKLIKKIIENPKIGKPMKYQRKGTREVYLKPFRLSYKFDVDDDTLIFLKYYHKNKQ